MTKEERKQKRLAKQQWIEKQTTELMDETSIPRKEATAKAKILYDNREEK